MTELLRRCVTCHRKVPASHFLSHPDHIAAGPARTPAVKVSAPRPLPVPRPSPAPAAVTVSVAPSWQARPPDDSDEEEWDEEDGEYEESDEEETEYGATAAVYTGPSLFAVLPWPAKAIAAFVLIAGVALAVMLKRAMPAPVIAQTAPSSAPVSAAPTPAPTPAPAPVDAGTVNHAIPASDTPPSPFSLADLPHLPGGR